MVKSGRRKGKGEIKKKYAPLYFLLSGIFMLIGFTIACFMAFNLVQTKTLKIDSEQLEVGDLKIPLSAIRRTYIHREGSGIPFNGLGVKKGSDNSLVIEFTGGKSIILSEDFYPLEGIVEAIQSLKKGVQ